MKWRRSSESVDAERAVVKRKEQKHGPATIPTNPLRSIRTYSPSRRDLPLSAGALLLAPAGKAFTRRRQAGTFDVPVIGAGTAGIPTTFLCARRGARVLLIDKATTLGGSLHWSTGQVAAAA